VKHSVQAQSAEAGNSWVACHIPTPCRVMYLVLSLHARPLGTGNNLTALKLTMVSNAGLALHGLDAAQKLSSDAPTCTLPWFLLT